MNMGASSLAVFLAFVVGMYHGSTHPLAYGREHMFLLLVVGLSGPLCHAIGLLFASRADESISKAPLFGANTFGVIAVFSMAIFATAAAIHFTQKLSNDELWTMKGLGDVVQSGSEINRRRQPPVDQLLRIGKFVVDRLGVDMTGSSYDWRIKRFRSLMVGLGKSTANGEELDVKLYLSDKKAWGAGYLCDPIEVGRLSSCTVVHDKSPLKDDPNIIRVGLYQGAARIGRLGRRFLMSCGYSAGFCKIEIIDPWFDGLTVALLYKPSQPVRWADVISFAVPEIDRIVRPVP